MKNAISVLLLLPLCMCSAAKDPKAAGTAQSAQYKVEVNVLNVRELPDSKSKIVATFVKNDMVTLIEKTDKKETVEGITSCWVKVRKNNVTGYVFYNYISEKTAFSDQAALLKKKLIMKDLTTAEYASDQFYGNGDAGCSWSEQAVLTIDFENKRIYNGIMYTDHGGEILGICNEGDWFSFLCRGSIGDRLDIVSLKVPSGSQVTVAEGELGGAYHPGAAQRREGGCEDIEKHFKESAEKMRINTPLIYYIENGKIDKAKSLIRSGASIDERGSLGVTPLMVAAQRGRLEIMELLLERKARVNETNARGETALFYAVKPFNNEEMAVPMTEFLLKHGADVKARTIEGKTLLMRALETSRPAKEMLELLLKNNININAKDNHGCNAIINACYSDESKEVIEILLKHGADIYATTNAGSNVLLQLAKNSRTDIFSMLDVKKVRGASEIDHNGWTPLFYAVEKNNLAIVRFLVEAGADVNYSLHGVTALFIAKTLGQKDTSEFLAGSGVKK